MNFELTEEQLAMQETARRFAREKLMPQYQEGDKTGQLNRDLVRQMGKLGLIGVELPQEYGGLGTDGVPAGVIIDEIAYGDFPMSYVQLVGGLLGDILARFANRISLPNGCPR